jgi:hypothetical protein
MSGIFARLVAEISPSGFKASSTGIRCRGSSKWNDLKNRGHVTKHSARKIPDLLAEAKVRPAEVLVDYTGGTKTMSAALVLAGIEWFQQFSYVGGEQRDKSGLGVTIDGKERVLYAGNPWSELAVREIERARDLWADYQFEAAAGVLEVAATRVPRQQRFQTIANLARALAARHRLDLKDAKNSARQCQETGAVAFRWSE